MRRAEPRAPERLAHLGLGAFFRAHQAWYTDLANRAAASGMAGSDQAGSDGAGVWGIHAFSGRSPGLAAALTGQDCLYSLIERSSTTDTTTVVGSIVAASDGFDGVAWRRTLADPKTAVLTLTITEAGYLRTNDGGVDWSSAALKADLIALTADAAAPRGMQTAPARIVDGLRERWRSSAGPLAIVSCDNLPHNGEVTRQVVTHIAVKVDPALAEWIQSNVSFVSSMVDRITPAATPDDVLPGDAVPVVTEPFAEWILSGAFPAGRPLWEIGGARFVDDLERYEHRKLWLLNGGHSLLAYIGLSYGDATIDQAMGRAPVTALLEQLWREAREVLPLPQPEIDESLAALRVRFTNPRIRHQLAQIATDGSKKLSPRILDVHRARRIAGLPVGQAGVAVIVAWIRYLSGTSVDRFDAGAAALAADLRMGLGSADAAARVVHSLAPDLAADAELIDAITRLLDAPTIDAPPFAASLVTPLATESAALS